MTAGAARLLARAGLGDAVVLPRSFYDRDVHLVAPAMLNKVVVGPDGSAGRIVEVEAYEGRADPGSHGYRGPTARTQVMYGPPGHLYVYFTYGMHWCANAVCGPDTICSAVLLRALEPMAGIEAMRRRRPRARRLVDLCNGPAKLCQALAIDGAHNGADLVVGDRGVVIVDDGVAPPTRPGRSTRVGLTAGAELEWRVYVSGDPHVSRRRP